MRSTNSKAISRTESAHLAAVKSLPCSWCGGAGGYAHHIKQGQHWTCVATCWDCHQGPKGWHGDKTLQRIYKMDEIDALAVTIERLKKQEHTDVRQREAFPQEQAGGDTGLAEMQVHTARQVEAVHQPTGEGSV